MTRVALLLLRFPGLAALAAAAALWAIFLADPAHGSFTPEPPRTAWCVWVEADHYYCAGERKRMPAKWRNKAFPVPLIPLDQYERYTPVLPKEDA